MSDTVCDETLQRYSRVLRLNTYIIESNFSRGFNSGAALFNLFTPMCSLNSREAPIRGQLQFEEIR